VSISVRELRAKLGSGQPPDPRIMRPETAQTLIERMKAGWTWRRTVSGRERDHLPP
jgi:hypothetical protein